MTKSLSRRCFATGLGASIALAGVSAQRAHGAAAADAEIFRTPYKFGKRILSASDVAGAFDEKSVDDPFVFRLGDEFRMLYIAYDGIGYQTGMARSKDLLHWERMGCVAARNPNSKWTKYNLALACLLRNHSLAGSGKLKKVNGRYLGAWNAYPNAGYEEGAAVIGLAWSDDLRHWELTDPILFPADGTAWEHGGLYRPNLIEEHGSYYLYYNAKTDKLPKREGGGWREQSGVATSSDLKTWTRYAGNPILQNGDANSRDARFASNPFVVRHKQQLAMYYFGYDRAGTARELLALGRDPYHFTKVEQPVIDVGAPGTVDETYAHKTSVIWHNGDLYHFYCAVEGRWPHEKRGITVARSRAFTSKEQA